MNGFDLKALIFDMDGVIIDSEPIHFRAFRQFFQSIGIEYTPQENALYLGRRDIEISAILIEKFNLSYTPEELTEKKETIFAELIRQEALPRPGLMDTLEEATGLNLPIAVASSATMPSIKLIVDALKIGRYFHNLSSGDEVKSGKPAPDVFLLAASRMQVHPSNCLVIEDTEAGVEAAKRAGMRVVAIPCEATRHQTHDEADMRVGSLSELKLKDWVLN